MTRKTTSFLFSLSMILSISLLAQDALAEERFYTGAVSAQSISPKTQVIEGGGLVAIITPAIVSADDPANHVVGGGGVLDGVGDVSLTLPGGTGRCSGSLMLDGRHVLTAAHCLTDGAGVPDVTAVSVTFEGDLGNETIAADTWFIHPAWDGNLTRGNDVAILRLVSEASADITRYDIDRNGGDDVGQVGQKVGYGRSGNGNTGDTIGSGTKREGDNLYDALGDTMLVALGLTPGTDFVAGSQLQYDFDNGIAANDAFDFFFGLTDLGTGAANEVDVAPGDSGGGTFTGGVVTGIHSYSITLTFTNGTTSDIDAVDNNNTFGEFGGDARVALYADWIDDTIGTNTPPTADAGGPYAEECEGTTTSIALDGTGSSDPDPGDSLTYAWLTDCSGPGFDDATSATPTLTVDSSACIAFCSATLTVTDEEGESDSDTATVTVSDTVSPTLTCPADVTIECDASTDPSNTGQGTATDVCDPDVTESFVDVTTPGACAAEFEISRQWSAIDDCGNTDGCTQTISVVDTTAPVIDCGAPPTIIPPNAPISFTATATDDCSETSVTIASSDCFDFTKKGKRIDKTNSCVVSLNGDQITIVDSGGVGDNITWTVIATDACGNTHETLCALEVVKPNKPGKNKP
jgi:hypothetical protein